MPGGLKRQLFKVSLATLGMVNSWVNSELGTALGPLGPRTTPSGVLRDLELRPLSRQHQKPVQSFGMPRLSDDDSHDTDATSSDGGYFFSSWGYNDRQILRGLYRRYACSKVHVMKKIERSGNGRDCGHWPMWRAIAKTLSSEAHKKVSPADLEDFFWDVIDRGSEVTATLDQLLDCRPAGRPRSRSRSAVPKLKVEPSERRTAATSGDRNDHEPPVATVYSLAPRHTSDEDLPIYSLPPRHTSDEDIPLDLTHRRPPRVEVKVEHCSLDQGGVAALSEPTTAENGGAAEELVLLPAFEATFGSDAASTVDYVLRQIPIANHYQPDASAAEVDFSFCPKYPGLFAAAGPFFSDGTGIMGSASPAPPPVQCADKEVQCKLDDDELLQMFKEEHKTQMEMLVAQRDAFCKKEKCWTEQP